MLNFNYLNKIRASISVFRTATRLPICSFFQVATALGDMQLAGKCRINVAYNYIWQGQYAEAQRIIRAQVGQSRYISLRRYFEVRVRDLEAKALT